MIRKNLILAVSSLFIGITIGSAGSLIFISGHVKTAFKSLEARYIAELSQRAYKAYKNEAPEVVAWELSNFVQVLNSQLKHAKGLDRKVIQKDLVLTHGRLALVSKEAGWLKKYTDNLAEAIRLSKSVYPDEIVDESSLFNFVKRADDNN